MTSSGTFSDQRKQLIGRLTAMVRGDERLRALWLQGSLADGTADPWSDVDAYLAVRDEDFDEVYGGHLALVHRLGTVLISAEMLSIPAINCLMDGPVKLDLLFEPVGRAGELVRPAVRMLVDKDGIGDKLRTGWQPAAEAAEAFIDRLFRATVQGAAWPVRLLGRDQWSTMAQTELFLVNETLVPLMAVQIDTRYLFKNGISRPRLLPSEQRGLIEELGEAVCEAAARRDSGALRDVHLRLLDLLYREGRAAYGVLGLPYPLTDEAEAAIRRFYLHAWPV